MKSKGWVRFALVCAALTASALAPCAASTPIVGIQELEVPAPQRHATSHVSVWYPAASGGTETLIGDNGVFHGVEAWREAPIPPGKFPLVIISHGGLRAAPEMAGWLAAALAARGFIAVVSDPPRVPTGPPSQSDLHELWLRPADLSAAISTMEESPIFGKSVDASKVAAVGFFLGGYSALALAGARIDPSLFSHLCDQPIKSVDCAWLAKGGVLPSRVDSISVARSNSDTRVKGVVIVDPELSEVLDGDTLAKISVPSFLINLGTPNTLPPLLDSSPLKSKIRFGKFTTMASGSPFSSFAECKPKGAAILASDGGETGLCEDGSNTTRAKIHERLVAVISEDLDVIFAKK